MICVIFLTGSPLGLQIRRMLDNEAVCKSNSWDDASEQDLIANTNRWHARAFDCCHFVDAVRPCSISCLLFSKFVHGSGAFGVLRTLRRALRYYCSFLSYANIGLSLGKKATNMRQPKFWEQLAPKVWSNPLCCHVLPPAATSSKACPKLSSCTYRSTGCYTVLPAFIRHHRF